jgi:hypothetical protein
MAKQKRLVIQHLENISWGVLKEYPQIIKEMIHGKSGVYVLYRRGKLYYVGLATNLMARLKIHLRDRHHGAWDRFSVYLTVHDNHIKELESLILRITHPTGNKTGGRFADSQNLVSSLNQKIKGYDTDRRAILIGGNVKIRRQKAKLKNVKGTKSLIGIVDRRIKLKAKYKGREYSATLRKDGKIGYNGKIYESPSGAGRAIIKRACNGWAFWRYRNEKGEWVRLKELRK